MKIIVFGATGSIGRLAVEQLLQAGHAVTAFARSPGGLAGLAGDLTLCAGDALDAEAVAAAIAGQDAVVVTLGAGTARKGVIRSRGTLNVIGGMQRHGVRRLICQSTLGAHDSWGNLNFFWQRIMFGALLRPVFQDHELQELLVRASGLDWTIIRPSAFTDTPTQTPVQIDIPPSARNLALKISRSEVARFLLSQIEDRRFLHRAVGLSS